MTTHRDTNRAYFHISKERWKEIFGKEERDSKEEPTEDLYEKVSKERIEELLQQGKVTQKEE